MVFVPHEHCHRDSGGPAHHQCHYTSTTPRQNNSSAPLPQSLRVASPSCQAVTADQCCSAAVLAVHNQHNSHASEYVPHSVSLRLQACTDWHVTYAATNAMTLEIMPMFVAPFHTMTNLFHRKLVYYISSIRWQSRISAAILLATILLVCATTTVSASDNTIIRDPQHCDALERMIGVPDEEQLFIADKLMNITIVESPRNVHRLLTEIVAILLKQQLGYVNLKIHTVDYRNHSNSNPYYGNEYNDLLLPSPILPDLHIQRTDIPKYMVDLQVWMNPSIPVTSDVYETRGFLGGAGRFAWFLPTFLLSMTKNMIDHWRSYSISPSEIVDKFYRTPEELAALYHLLHTSSNVPHCPAPKCNGSIYTPPWCISSKCSILFAGDYATGRYLPEQIEQKQLYVKVAYLGPNLSRKFIDDNIALSDGRSILVFHWTPSYLLHGLNFSAVVFPPCQLEGPDPHLFCYYELHRMNKFVWSRLQTHAVTLYNAIDQVSFTPSQFNSLANKSAHSSRMDSIGDVACSWIQENVGTWKDWNFTKHRKILYIVGFFPISQSSGQCATHNSSAVVHRWFKKFAAPGNVPAFEMAVEAVNRNTSILNNYFLEYYRLPSDCKVDVVLNNFINLVISMSGSKSWKDLIGIVGPACSDTVEPIAGVAKQYDIPIISYGAEGAIFSDEKSYPNFFRTIPENKIFRYVYHKLFSQLNWKRIASLTEDEQGYSEYLTPLNYLLEENGFVFKMRKYRHNHMTMNMSVHLDFMKEERITVIIGDFYEDVAASILCQAYHMGLTAKDHFVWFLPTWYSKDWFKCEQVLENGQNCTVQQMYQALEGHMTLSYQYFGDHQQIMQEGITVNEWYKNYTKRVENINSQNQGSNSPIIDVSSYAGFTYDAVWSFALALDKLSQENKSYMADMRADKTMIAYLKKLESLHFAGVSGDVSFKNSHSRTTDIIIHQFQNGSYKEVAIFKTDPVNATNSILQLDLSKITWPNGKPEDKQEECWAEPLRIIFNTDCDDARIAAYTLIPVFCLAVLFLGFFLTRRYYRRRVKEIEEQWRQNNLLVFNKFNGWEVKREDLVLNRKLGEGQYGVIYGGECNVAAHGWVPVAAKTLKTGSSMNQKVEFLAEAEMLKNLQHDNVVRMLGVCIEGEPIYVIMEFMLHGDLKTYLLARRNLVYNQARNENDEVSNFRLTSMVRDVARGLQFLAEHKYVHRDLACRNCLVNVHKTVKIGDFGMTRAVYESKSYYRFSRRAYLPVRWMAPESLKEGIYTSMSDIWSFGVVLYEVITFGTFPFKNLSNSQVVEYVSQEGKTLEPPPDIDRLLECLLLQCWNWMPSRRPTASQIVVTFNNHPHLVSPSLESPQASVMQGVTAAMEPPIPKGTARPIPSTTSLTRRLSLHPPRALPQSSASAAFFNSRQNSTSSASSHNQAGRHSSGGSNCSAAGPGTVVSTVGGVVAGLISTATNGRKRSMSGNMAVPPITCSLSDTTIGDPCVSGHNHTTLEALNLSVSAVVMEERSEDGDNSNEAVDNTHDNVVDQQSGESSGYATSTGTGTGGSNASTSRRADNSAPSTPSRNNSEIAGCISNSCRSGHSNYMQALNDTKAYCEGKGMFAGSTSPPNAYRKNNMFYRSSQNGCFTENNHPSLLEDEGSVPLLPQVGFAGEITNKSVNNRRRTPTPDTLLPLEELGGSVGTAAGGSGIGKDFLQYRRGRFNKRGSSSTSSSSSSSNSTATSKTISNG